MEELLLRNRPPLDDSWWPWLMERPLTRRTANKFLLASSNEYHRTDDVEERVETYVESFLGPSEGDDLWGHIARLGEADYKSWLDEASRFHLHQQLAHLETVWRMAKRLVRLYGGDAREIWAGNPTPAEVIQTLEDDLGLSEELSHMTAGALADRKLIEGRGPLKADTHVRRVLGRILVGRKLSRDEAHIAAEWIHPENPWVIDRSLYTLGIALCHERRSPECHSCYMGHECVFVKG